MIKELFKFFAEFIVGWFTYKHRGHAKPDHPDQKNYPIITDAADASAQKQIDRVYKSKNSKKK